MRSFAFVLLGGLAGCGVDHGQWEPSGEPSDPATQSAEAPAVGEVSQAAQFATFAVINEVGLQSNGMSLLINSDGAPSTTIQIFYAGDKTTDTGRTVLAPVLKHTVTLATDKTTKVDINLADSAFTGNYGSIQLRSIDSDPLFAFQTYVQSGLDIWSAGGSVFSGGAFRIPYWSGTTRIVLTVTNLSSIPFSVQFANIGKADVHTINNLIPGSTYKFDSQTYSWNLTGTSSVQITTTDGGLIYLSGYEVRGGTNKYRIVPVKTSPFP